MRMPAVYNFANRDYVDDANDILPDIHELMIKKTLQAQGGTPFYGLNGDVRPDRVWFCSLFYLKRVSI